MKKYLALTALLLCLGLLAGCASNKVTTTSLDANNKPVTVTTDMSDSAMFHQAQAAGFAARRPIAELELPNGGTLPAGTKFTVWGDNGNTRVTQYSEPWLEAFKHGSGIMGMGLLGYIMGYGDNFKPQPAKDPLVVKPEIMKTPDPLVVKPEIITVPAAQ